MRCTYYKKVFVWCWRLFAIGSQTNDVYTLLSSRKRIKINKLNGNDDTNTFPCLSTMRKTFAHSFWPCWVVIGVMSSGVSPMGWALHSSQCLVWPFQFIFLEYFFLERVKRWWWTFLINFCNGHHHDIVIFTDSSTMSMKFKTLLFYTNDPLSSIIFRRMNFIYNSRWWKSFPYSQFPL